MKKRASLSWVASASLLVNELTIDCLFLRKSFFTLKLRQQKLILERALIWTPPYSNHNELPRGVRSQRPDWWRQGGALTRPLTHEEVVHTSTTCAPHPPTPAAALVEDEPSGSAAKRHKVNVDPFLRDWFLDMLDHWRTERQWGIPRCLGEVQRLCPWDVRRDQPEHSVPLETERGSTAWQEKSALTRRHDTAERAHPASD